MGSNVEYAPFGSKTTRTVIGSALSEPSLIVVSGEVPELEGERVRLDGDGLGGGHCRKLKLTETRWGRSAVMRILPCPFAK